MADTSDESPVDSSDRLAALETRLRLAQQELERLRLREDEVMASASWRVTAPLRALGAWWRQRRTGRALSGRTPASKRPKVGDASAETESEGARGKDAVIARARALLPKLPASCVAGGDNGPGDVHRLLDVSEAMSSLVGDAAADFFSRSEQTRADRDVHYFGRREDAPAIAFFGSRELLGEIAFDARVAAIREDDWERQLVPGRFAFALIECAWHGDRHDWSAALVADGGGRPVAERMLRLCRDIGLPLVAWYRGDADYEHFAWIGAQVDRAYATDADLAGRLRRDHPETPVDVLPVAVQPALHNPIRPFSLVEVSNYASRLALFDGWWALAEGGADDALIGELQPILRVVESEWDYARQRLGDCPALANRALGCAGTLERAALGRMFGAEIFLESALQPAWRRQSMVLRSAAAGALTVQVGKEAGPSSPMPGMPVRGSAGDLAKLVRNTLDDPLQRMRRAHAQVRQVMSGHSLVDLLQRIATDLELEGTTFVDPPPRVACLLVTMRLHLLPGCLERFRRDRYPDKELIVVLHDDQADLEAARRLVHAGEPIQIFRMGRSHGLGACLNFAFAQTTAPFWAKIDDDDLYGVDYLSDMMLYQRMVDVPLMGKPIAFVYFEDDDALHWVPAWAEQRSLRLWQPGHGQPLIAGGSLVGRRELLEVVPFSERRRRGSDSDFILRCQTHGYSVLATDCFNFALFRSGQPGFHTWNGGGEDARGLSTSVTPLAEASKSVFL